MDYQVSYTDEVSSLANAASAALGGMTVAFVIVAVLGVVNIIAMWKIFNKAGRPGWAAIVPFYNYVVLLQICGISGWWTIGLFVPVLGIGVVVWVCINLAKAFGKDGGFAVGLFFLSPVFYMILGFGNAQYVGVPGARNNSVANGGQYNNPNQPVASAPAALPAAGANGTTGSATVQVQWSAPANATPATTPAAPANAAPVSTALNPTGTPVAAAPVANPVTPAPAPNAAPNAAPNPAPNATPNPSPNPAPNPAGAPTARPDTPLDAISDTPTDMSTDVTLPPTNS